MATDDSWFYDNVYTGAEHECVRTRVLCEKVEARDGGRHRYRVVIELMDGAEAGALNNRPDVVDINFQNGSVGEFGVNGIEDEGLLAVLVDRLRRFLNSGHDCVENTEAMGALLTALEWMKKRDQNKSRKGES